MKTPVKAGPQCILCEFIMKELEQRLGSRPTEAEITAALQQVCKLLPASLKQDCDNFIKENLPRLIELLLEVKPKQVCTYLGVCSSENSALDQPGKCILCNLVMTKLKSLLTSDPVVEDIEVALKKVCSLLPGSLRENCRYFVEDLTPGVLRLIFKKAPPEQICVFLKACPGPTQDVPTQAIPVEISALTARSDLCDFCEYVIQYLDDVLEGNITRGEIEEAIHKVCSIVPAELKDFCDKFLEEQADKIIDLLEQTLDPQGLCKSAGLCNDHDRSHNVKMDKVDYCEFCERVAYDVDLLLQQNFTEPAIEAALHEVCKTFDARAHDSCEQFVTQYTKVFIDVLLHVPPEKLCIAVKMCPEHPVPSVTDKSDSLQFIPESDQSSTALSRPINYHPHCSSCKFLFYYLQTSLVDSFWRDTAKNSMYEFCLQLKTEQDVCRLLMDMNADQVLGAVRGFRFPETFCQSTDMCEPPFNDDNSMSAPTFSNALMKQPVDASDSFPYCNSCKWLASELNGVVSQPEWKAQVRTSLDEICELMADGKDVCKRIIAENIDHIITNIGTSGWPDQICQAINLCSIPSKKVLSIGEISCGLCEKISPTAQVFLKTGASPDRVIEYLEMACSTATDNLDKERCQTIVRQYAGELMEILKTEEDPKAACKTVDLCFAP